MKTNIALILSCLLLVGGASGSPAKSFLPHVNTLQSRAAMLRHLPKASSVQSTKAAGMFHHPKGSVWSREKMAKVHVPVCCFTSPFSCFCCSGLCRR